MLQGVPQALQDKHTYLLFGCCIVRVMWKPKISVNIHLSVSSWALGSGVAGAVITGALHWELKAVPGWGGGGIPCGGKYESTNSGATKSVPLIKREQTNYVWFPIIAHEKQWALAVITCTNP